MPSRLHDMIQLWISAWSYWQGEGAWHQPWIWLIRSAEFVEQVNEGEEIIHYESLVIFRFFVTLEKWKFFVSSKPSESSFFLRLGSCFPEGCFLHLLVWGVVRSTKTTPVRLSLGLCQKTFNKNFWKNLRDSKQSRSTLL